MSHDVEEEISLLYQGESDAFLEGRKTLAAKLKKASDKESAARVLALAKPTPSAWATNRVSVTARHAFIAMLEQGKRLRSAMRESLRGASGQQVALLQREQRESIEAVVAEASRLLEEAKLPSTNVVMGRVRTNLSTIAMTGRWGDTRAACLSKDLAPLDIGALAALLDELPDESPLESLEHPPIAHRSQTEVAPKTLPNKPNEEQEKKERFRREKIRALEAELAEASALVAASEAVLAKRAEVNDAAALSHSEANERFVAATREAARLEALANDAREQASRARHDVDTEKANLATAKRDKDKAAQSLARETTHLEAARERLDNAKREGSSML
jgi:hypothetical protein